MTRFPEKMSDLYTCKVEPTGKILYRVDPKHYTPGVYIDPLEVQKHQQVNEIAILMPENEYNKFAKDWDNYVDVLLASKNNPIVKEQLEKLLVLVHLYK
jgi:hypothetical protein